MEREILRLAEELGTDAGAVRLLEKGKVFRVQEGAVREDCR